MLVYDLAVCIDKGHFWEVVNMTTNTLDNPGGYNDPLLKLSNVAAKIIKDGIESKHIVRIRKPLRTTELLPFEVDVIEPDTNDLDYIKQLSAQKIKTIVTPDMTKESGYTLYEFMIKNNELASRGYFIVDSNREEKYIEIIETGDDTLISLLESYLEANDKVQRAFFLKDKVETFIKSVKDCESVEQITELENQFLASFYHA